MIIGIDCQFKGKVKFEECLKCAAETRNECQFTIYLIRKMIDDLEDRTGISVTSLLGCPRKVYLERTNEFYIPLEWLWYTFRGSMIHEIAEQGTKGLNYVVERRFSKTIHGVLVTGKPDVLIPEQELLQDIKTTETVPKFNNPYTNHTLQANIYRYIIMDNPDYLDDSGKPFKISRLEIVYMSMKDVKRLPCKVMEPAAVEKVLEKPISVLNLALTKGVMPERTPVAERWQCAYCCLKEKCLDIEVENLKESIRGELKKEILKELHEGFALGEI